MARLILIATSGAQPGREADFNRWYDEVHAPQVCSIPGVVSCRRYRQSAQSPLPAPAPFLAIYEIETDDPKAVMGELLRRASKGELTQSSALDPSNAKLWLYEAH
jgi:hypothetical protein